MNDDRELLELAAKAAGMDGCAVEYDDRLVFLEDGKPASTEWSPLTNDGDALRLAVKLQLHLEWWPICGDGAVGACTDRVKHTEPWRDDKYAATRRAIVRAAAEIGRAME